MFWSPFIDLRLELPCTQVGPSPGARPSANVVSHFRQRHSVVDGSAGRGSQRQIPRGWGHKIAFQPASQVVTELRLATVKLNLTVHQIVHDLRVCGPGSNTDPSFPVPFRPPDGVVENLDSIGVPKLDPAIRPAGDKVVADHAVGDVGE